MAISQVPSTLLLRKYTGHNHIINGKFHYTQRATTQTGNGYGSDDRWSNDRSGATRTQTFVTFSLGEVFPDGTLCVGQYCRNVVAAGTLASDFVTKRQRIEDVTRFSNKLVTLSFYAKADAVKTLGIEFKQDFGTGGSPSTAVTINKVITLSTTWTKYTISVMLPSIAGKILGSNDDSFFHILFWFNAGTNYFTSSSLNNQAGTFDLAHVVLVEGDESIVPIPRTTFEEFDLCSQYFDIISCTVIKSTTSGMHVGSGVYTFYYKRPRKKSPTLTAYTDTSLTTPGITAVVGGVSSVKSIDTLSVGRNLHWVDIWNYTALVSVGDYCDFILTVDSEI